MVQDKAATTPESPTDRMKKRIDPPAGRVRYGRGFATVEPVFGNLRYNKGLDRFTLRGQAKVDAQRKLLCVVPNIEKLARPPQPIAFLRRTTILASSAAVNSLSAKAVGHMAPSSRFAVSLKPRVA